MFWRYKKVTGCSMLRNPWVMSSGNVRNSCEKEIVLQVPQIKVCIKTERWQQTVLLSRLSAVEFNLKCISFNSSIYYLAQMDSYVESNVTHLSTDCSSALTATCTTCCTDALQVVCTLKVSLGSGVFFGQKIQEKLKILSRPPSFVDTNVCWTVGVM